MQISYDRITCMDAYHVAYQYSHFFIKTLFQTKVTTHVQYCHHYTGWRILQSNQTKLTFYCRYDEAHLLEPFPLSENRLVLVYFSGCQAPYNRTCICLHCRLSYPGKGILVPSQVCHKDCWCTSCRLHLQRQRTVSFTGVKLMIAYNPTRMFRIMTQIWFIKKSFSEFDKYPPQKKADDELVGCGV